MLQRTLFRPSHWVIGCLLLLGCVMGCSAPENSGEGIGEATITRTPRVREGRPTGVLEAVVPTGEPGEALTFWVDYRGMGPDTGRTQVWHFSRENGYRSVDVLEGHIVAAPRSAQLVTNEEYLVVEGWGEFRDFRTFFWVFDLKTGDSLSRFPLVDAFERGIFPASNIEKTRPLKMGFYGNTLVLNSDPEKELAAVKIPEGERLWYMDQSSWRGMDEGKLLVHHLVPDEFIGTVWVDIATGDTVRGPKGYPEGCEGEVFTRHGKFVYRVDPETLENRPIQVGKDIVWDPNGEVSDYVRPWFNFSGHYDGNILLSGGSGHALRFSPDQPDQLDRTTLPRIIYGLPEPILYDHQDSRNDAIHYLDGEIPRYVLFPNSNGKGNDDRFSFLDMKEWKWHHFPAKRGTAMEVQQLFYYQGDILIYTDPAEGRELILLDGDALRVKKAVTFEGEGTSMMHSLAPFAFLGNKLWLKTQGKREEGACISIFDLDRFELEFSKENCLTSRDITQEYRRKIAPQGFVLGTKSPE